MEIKVYNSESIPSSVYQSVSDLLHDSFDERKSQGIDIKCGSYSPDDVKKCLHSGGGYLFLAYEQNLLVGVLFFIIRKKMRYIYGGHDVIAVSSSAKGKGVASLLFQKMLLLANQLNLDFITSTTPVNALSSVRFHKKMGFLIYRKSYGQSYNAYNFIYPIKCMKFLKCSLVRRTLYMGINILAGLKKL